jgi:hypothetical protein
MSGLSRRHEVWAAALTNPSFDRDASERAMRAYCRDVVLVPSRPEDFRKRVTQARSLVSRRTFEANFLTFGVLSTHGSPRRRSTWSSCRRASS